ncbi:retrovirus-related pol polyprotein from transposon TNT 1-94 [Tanacetum coccineum]
MLTKPQFFYDHTTKQALGFQNLFYLKKAQQLEPKLYDGNVIKNTRAILILNSEETLLLAKESQPTLPSRPTKVKVPKELPKVSMVNMSLKKLKHHIAGFDMVVKERTMATAITEGLDNSVSNQSAPSFDQLFELNELKAQSQEKDTAIKKLKERIKSLSGKMNEDKIKKDLEEIETINIELDHKEKVLVITTLKDDLRKLKGKALVDNDVTKHPSDPEMLMEPITPKLLNKRTAHSAYIKHTQEEAAEGAVRRDLVDSCRPNCSLVFGLWLLLVNKFLGIVKFGNDHVAKILGFGDYQIENFTISRVYYVEGLGHNLFSVGQLCDSNLEVAFRQHTCFICNLEGVDLLTGSRARHGLVQGLPKLKFEKDHLCLLVQWVKEKKKPHKPKSKDTNQEKLYLLHMDLCGPMRVASVNGKKYILVIVDDYSRFTWIKCLRSKDEPSDFIIKFLKMIQVRLKVPVRHIRKDNGTEFVNQTLREYYEKVGISHETCNNPKFSLM